jgi:DNA recombination protein RmuC
MIYVACVLGGLFVGGALAWLWASGRSAAALAEAERRASTAQGQMEVLREQVGKAAADFDTLRADLGNEKEARVRAETECSGTLERLEEEKKILEDAKAALADAFKALSADALASNNATFLQLARESMDKALAAAKGDLEKRQMAIDGVVKPLADAVTRYELNARLIQKDHAALTENLKNLSDGQLRLQRETGNLVSALRRPEVRGRWGEIQLRRVVELAGMSDHCDFDEQVTVGSEAGRIRPDMVVRLPGGRQIVVDTKTPIDAYLTAMSAETEEARKGSMEEHAKQMRRHMEDLARKEYWKQFEQTPELVVMFIPGESFFAAAVDCDHALIEDGMESGVVLATPTTLIALLRAIAFGWRQEQIAKNAQKISELGRDLYERMRTLAGHLVDMGKALDKTTREYNEAVGSIEARVLPTARKFKELGAVSSEDIPIVEPVESVPRKLSAPELTGEGETGAP